MNFETAQRTTEILLALAFAQSSLEHFYLSRRHRILFTLRLICCLAVLSGLYVSFSLLVLFANALILLHFFQGPYNGGSDKMGVLILTCLALSHIGPTLFWQEMAFAYLAFQLTLSYFISGRVKLVNQEWRCGDALRDVFAFSVYPVGENLRALAHRPTVLWVMSWAVILFEVLFPLALFNPYALWIALMIAATFHLANACLFGLNRFLWIWLAAYPSLI